MNHIGLITESQIFKNRCRFLEIFAIFVDIIDTIMVETYREVHPTSLMAKSSWRSPQQAGSHPTISILKNSMRRLGYIIMGQGI